MENSNGSLMFIVISNIISEIDIFIMKKISNTKGLSGITNNDTMIMTNNEIALLKIFFIFASPLTSAQLIFKSCGSIYKHKPKSRQPHHKILWARPDSGLFLHKSPLPGAYFQSQKRHALPQP